MAWSTTTTPRWDAAEAERLYDLLENEIIPEFYDRDADGIPRRWIARVRESMARLTPEFSTNRMIEDYLDRYYLPGAVAYRERAGRGASELLAWREMLEARWNELSFVDYAVETVDGSEGQIHLFEVKVSAGRVPAGAFHVEVYAEPGEIHVLERIGHDARGVVSYTASVAGHRRAGEYTPRIVPWHPSARVPLECDRILWYR